MSSAWVVCHQTKVGMPFRVFCFPYAGSGASAFFSWGRALVSHPLEIHSIQLPGRETRLREKSLHSAEALVQGVVEALIPVMTHASIFLGHSMGSLLAFEVCRELRRRKARLPLKLLACGSKPPHLVHLNRRLHHLDDRTFIDTIVRDYNGIPRELLDQPEIVELICPILKADFAVMETYVHCEEPPLGIPIVAFGGETDDTVPRSDLLQWNRHTASGFKERIFSGGHFFINESREAVVRAVLEEVRDAGGPWRET